MKLRYILLFLVFLCPLVTIAQDLREFEEYVRKEMKRDKIPGMTIGFEKGDYVWVKGFGYSDLENQVASKPETAYRLASVSKSMTAVAILQLVEQGKINLDAEVQTYMPYFPKKKWPITVRQVLGHLGGISHYKNYEQEGHIKVHKTTREAIEIFSNFDLVAEPGTQYSYSTYGYNLLGAIVEAASGQNFGDYMREHVWKVAEMDNTRLDDPIDLIPNRAHGYQKINGQIKNSEFVDISSRFGGGGTRSTVPDLLKYVRSLNHGKLLAADSLNAMYSSMLTKDGHLTYYGMGWETQPHNGQFVLVHTGGQQETRTILIQFPQKDVAIAAAMNFESESPYRFVTMLYQVLFDRPWDLFVYTGDKRSSLLYKSIQTTFNEGASYFERYQKPFPSNPTELAAAFSYFNRATSSANLKQMLEQVNEGAHPASKQPFLKIGSYMASQIRNHDLPEPISFFQAYILAYQHNSAIRKDFRFSNSFEKQITRWNDSWIKTNSTIRNLQITADSDPDQLRTTMKTAFAGATIYRDFTDPLAETTQQLAMSGDLNKAFRFASLSADLYPESDTSNALMGIVQLLQGKFEAAHAHLKKAVAMSNEGWAGSPSLNSFAYQLVEANHLDQALQLLKIAEELYPREANLYDSMGEFYLKKGDKENAIACYKKALELDPKSESAQKALQELQK